MLRAAAKHLLRFAVTMAMPMRKNLEWWDTYRSFRHEIDRGILAPGTDLPTISKLAKDTGLSPYAARKVMERLRQGGHVQSWQGKGYRVAMPVIRLRMDHKSPVFGARLRALGFSARSELVAARKVGLPSTVAHRLGTRPGARAKLTETLREVNGRPVALSMDYFADRKFDDIDLVALAATGSVSAALAEVGIDEYRRDFTELTCRPPTAHEALVLNIPRTQSVYVTMGGNTDNKGELFQISKAIWRSDCVCYEF